MDMLLKIFTKYLKGILHRVLSFFLRHPECRRHAVAIIKICGLYRSAQTVYQRIFLGSGVSVVREAVPLDVAHLSPRGRRICADLKTNIELNKILH